MPYDNVLSHRPSMFIHTLVLEKEGKVNDVSKCSWELRTFPRNYVVLWKTTEQTEIFHIWCRHPDMASLHHLSGHGFCCWVRGLMALRAATNPYFHNCLVYKTLGNDNFQVTAVDQMG